MSWHKVVQKYVVKRKVVLKRKRSIKEWWVRKVEVSRRKMYIYTCQSGMIDSLRVAVIVQSLLL